MRTDAIVLFWRDCEELKNPRSKTYKSVLFDGCLSIMVFFLFLVLLSLISLSFEVQVRVSLLHCRSDFWSDGAGDSLDSSELLTLLITSPTFLLEQNRFWFSTVQSCNFPRIFAVILNVPAAGTQSFHPKNNYLTNLICVLELLPTTRLS